MFHLHSRTVGIRENLWELLCTEKIVVFIQWQEICMATSDAE